MFAAVEEPPQVGRPVDFSGVVGRFRIEADVSPKSVPVEDPLTLRVTIRGEGVTTPPTRGDLRIFPEDFDFFREDVADEDRADPKAGTWTFVWRLRPKSTDVREVPALRLVYWSPMLRRFQAATIDPVPIEVRPAEAVKAPAPVSTVPPEQRLFDIEPSIWDSPMIEIGVWALALALAFGLLLWNEFGRSAAYSAADVLAIVELKHGGAAALVRYLQLRFSMKTGEPTPTEIDFALRRADVSPELRERWTKWWRRYDERRFSASRTEAATEREQAADLIRRTEAACSRR
jgi:hypothetical protein